jgi:hypothetical protein
MNKTNLSKHEMILEKYRNMINKPDVAKGVQQSKVKNVY